MRLDHIAYRVKDRNKSAQFFIDAFGYKIQQKFDVDFPDGTKAQCIALQPPERVQINGFFGYPDWSVKSEWSENTLHLAPEIFVSDGPEGSIVGDWVKARGDIGGVHHMAYQVEDVRLTMKLWLDKGWAEFTTSDILTCPDDELHQVFTKPNPLTGVIYEFIKRGENGFCQANVKDLMLSTKGLDKK